MPEREYYLVGRRRRWPRSATKYRAYVATGDDGRRASRSRRPRRSASSTSRPRSPAPMPRATRARTSPRARRSGAAPTSSRRRPGIDWAALLGRRPARQRAEVRGLSRRRRFRKLAALVGSEPLDAGRTGWRSTRSTSRRTCCPSAIRDASFAFYGTALTGTPQQRPRDKLALNAASNALAGRGRQGLCRQIFPGVGQGRDPGDGRQDQGRLRRAGRGARLDGAGDQGRKR